MDVPYPPPPSSEGDIFSISDQQLSDRLQFVEEIGFGNWGSVWLCRPKDIALDPANDSAYARVAVKLVHRSRTATARARVKNLWNEMKVVKSLKEDPHPSVVSFHSFIITRSYALIMMDYFPHLVPVEVPETKAKEWFRSLLSAVVFLHKRGVVHNDIKPANILLSTKRVPVLVDFGFAQHYDVHAKYAFLSNLAYGTPEYLSPERARGNLHDTRKSDVWALGVTFFEILVGRTPFEYKEGEQFATKEDLERYWSRTIKGKWLGKWHMSKTFERLLRMMILPNADLRCTAMDAMRSSYWFDAERELPPVPVSHKKGSSVSTIASAASATLRRTKNFASSGSIRDKRSQSSANRGPDVLDSAMKSPKSKPLKPRNVLGANLRLQNTDRLGPTLSPVKASPRRTRPSPMKENAIPNHDGAGKVKATRFKVPSSTVVPLVKYEPEMTKPRRDMSQPPRKRDGVQKTLSDVTSRSQNIVDTKTKDSMADVKQSKSRLDHSSERMLEFERWKETQRKELFDDLDAESFENIVLEEEDAVIAEGDSDPLGFTAKADTARMSGCLRKSSKCSRRGEFPSGLSSNVDISLNTSIMRSASVSDTSAFKDSLRVSFDKSLRLYKSSTLGKFYKRSMAALSTPADSAENDPFNHSSHETWENETFMREVESSLPVVRHAIRNERIGAATKADRMSIWIRNVEQIVKETQEHFAEVAEPELPPLPVPPRMASSHSISPTTKTQRRNSRLPRRILPANEIFNSSTCIHLSPARSEYETAYETIVVDDEPEVTTEECDTASPLPLAMPCITVSSNTSPGDSSDLLPLHKSETPPAVVMQNLLPGDVRKRNSGDEICLPVLNLSNVLDKDLFVAKSSSTPAFHEMPSIRTIPSIPVLTKLSSSCIPTIRSNESCDQSLIRESTSSPDMTSPTRRQHMEVVYDRFLMATSGVKRVGRGYQSDNAGAVLQIPPTHMKKRNTGLFNSVKREMPPPVSSDDLLPAMSMDELGVMAIASVDYGHHKAEAQSNTVRLMKNALKAIVAVRPTSRRPSKVF